MDFAAILDLVMLVSRALEAAANGIASVSPMHADQLMNTATQVKEKIAHLNNNGEQGNQQQNPQ